jgi:penicillin-binding protein 1A
MALRLGVRSPLDPVLTLPLGVSDITPIDMASAYATFANDGMRNEPYYVERIEDRNGKVLYQHQLNPVRVMDSQTARLVNQVLESNVTGGTGKNAQIDGGQPAAGKTGTTQDAADVWFVGYTPQLSTAIWMGAPVDRIPLSLGGLAATGGRYPATTWGRYYSLLMAGKPTVGFIPPDGTRRGKSVGKIPNEISGGRSTSSRGNGNGNGNRGGGGTTDPEVPDTVSPTQPGFGQDDD